MDYYLSTSSGTWGGSSGDHSDLSGLNRSDSDNSGVDTARDAVDLLNEELGEGVLLISRGLANISLGRSIDDVADSETLDSLILTNASAAVVASDVLNMAAAVLRSSVISALDRHSNRN